MNAEENRRIALEAQEFAERSGAVRIFSVRWLLALVVCASRYLTRKSWPWLGSHRTWPRC